MILARITSIARPAALVSLCAIALPDPLFLTVILRCGIEVRVVAGGERVLSNRLPDRRTIRILISPTNQSDEGLKRGKEGR